MVDAVAQLWAQLGNAQSQEAANSLLSLVDSYQSVTSAAQAAQLLRLLTAHPQEETFVRPCLLLLSRWERYQTTPSYARTQSDGAADPALLQDVTSIARQLLAAHGIVHPLGSPAAIFLCSAASVFKEPSQSAAVARVALTAMFDNQAPVPPQAAADGITAVGALLPGLGYNVDAVTCAIKALLAFIKNLRVQGADQPYALDYLSALHPMLRSFTTSALTRGGPDATEEVIIVLAQTFQASLVANKQQHNQVQQAASLLCLTGMFEGVLRSGSRLMSLSRLISDVDRDIHTALHSYSVYHSSRDGFNSGEPLFRDACSLALVQLWQTVRRPLPSADTLLCQTASLCHGALSLNALVAGAAAGKNQEQGMLINQYLGRLIKSALFTQAPALANSIAEQCHAVSRDVRMLVCQHVVDCARATHDSYRRYLIDTPAQWVAAVDGSAVRLVLDRNFATCFLLLGAVWSADRGTQPSAMSPQLAVHVLTVASDLQFCRSQSNQYTQILTEALSVLPDNGAAAAAVAGYLPCHADVAQQAAGPSGQWVWEGDTVIAAKVQFLFTALTPCISFLPQDVVFDRLAPLAFLYMLHPHLPTATSAHQLLWSVMTSSLPEEAQKLAPYYTSRCMEGYPHWVPGQLAAQGLGHMMQAMPCGSPVAVLCLEEMADRCKALLLSSSLDSSRQSNEATDLFSIISQQLLIVPYPLIPDCLEVVDDVVAVCHPIPVPVMSAVLGVIAKSDDCVRKPQLTQWYQRLSHRARTLHQVT